MLDLVELSLQQGLSGAPKPPATTPAVQEDLEILGQAITRLEATPSLAAAVAVEA